MKLEQLFLLHLMAGVGVAVCVYLSGRDRSARWFQTLAAVVFWPLFLPLLLSGRTRTDSEPPPQPVPGSLDEVDRAIAQVDEELEGVLQSLDGWGDGLRERAQGRLRELRVALDHPGVPGPRNGPGSWPGPGTLRRKATCRAWNESGAVRNCSARTLTSWGRFDRGRWTTCWRC